MGRRTGRAELDEHAEGVHFSEIDVDLMRSERPKVEVYADIRQRLSALPVSVAIGQPIGHRLDHLQSGVRAQIVLKIFGDDLETLRRLAETARQQLAAVPGVVDLQVEKQVLIPQLRIQVDYERAALYGLTPAAVTQALDALSNGRRVSQIVEGNRRFDVMMRLSDQDRSTAGLRDLLIATPTVTFRSECSPRSRKRTDPTKFSAKARSGVSSSTATATAAATWPPSPRTSAASSPP